VTLAKVPGDSGVEVSEAEEAEEAEELGEEECGAVLVGVAAALDLTAPIECVTLPSLMTTTLLPTAAHAGTRSITQKAAGAGREVTVRLTERATPPPAAAAAAVPSVLLPMRWVAGSVVRRVCWVSSSPPPFCPPSPFPPPTSFQFSVEGMN
jgi:hypothetical protein